MPTPASPSRRILLTFNAPVIPKNADQDKVSFCDSLSAIEFSDDGEMLFLGGDETVEATPSIERLSCETHSRYGRHVSQAVGAFMELPDTTVNKGRVGEIDIEGLSRDKDNLWVVGSHSMKRAKPKPSKTAQENIERLMKVESEGNRFFLARIPLQRDEQGNTRLPVDKDQHPSAARLAGKESHQELIEALQDDPHLGPFLQRWESKNPKCSVPAIPGKDNGFDVEGLCVKDKRIFLGLRGPVLRGWAIVLEIAVKEVDDGDDKLALKKISDDKRYIKHFINLGGLGVRDICALEDDLLILAGPTMNLDGPAAIFRWKGILAASADDDTLTDYGKGRLEKVLDLPCGEGCDHPEGMALIPVKSGAMPREVMIVYDSPSSARRLDENSVLADVFSLS